MKLLYFALIILMPLSSVLGQSELILVSDWSPMTFRSKHCGMITMEWMLEKRVQPNSDGKYKYYYRTRSRTNYLGSKSQVWVGFDIYILGGSGQNLKNSYGDDQHLSYGTTLNWDKRHTWDFYAASPSIELDFKKVYGWIGNYLNEIETKNELDECDQMACYRDKDLVETYDKALRKYEISSRSLKDIEKWKKEYMEDMDWATSDGVIIVKAIETLAKAFNNLIGFSSPKGKITKLIAQHDKLKSTDRKVRFLTAMGKSKSAMNIVIAEDVALAVFKHGLSQLNRVGKVYAFLDGLKSDIDDFSDYGDLKKEVAAQLVEFDNAIAKYQKDLKTNMSSLDVVIKYGNYIDAYLMENCKK